MRQMMMMTTNQNTNKSSARNNSIFCKDTTPQCISQLRALSFIATNQQREKGFRNIRSSWPQCAYQSALSPHFQQRLLSAHELLFPFLAYGTPAARQFWCRFSRFICWTFLLFLFFVNLKIMEVDKELLISRVFFFSVF